ncbi:hypothetical protein P170DRAFT_473807 [Aspergillus steynii IBT 23096]|uniref:Uncharacterized protein n=1 Tax=Aspergillus steynii IBT 23096 TaxID=1392250 RepID=A0A2I2GBI3_9EURO|nr:uncharacterized protein P170DRAFT_473807 [Aspergillus steynii IBT 23096]PLB50238.1 hypothetical protein P170DRAFT_473807 [Aspergillus steynii IBT 23096]
MNGGNQTPPMVDVDILPERRKWMTGDAGEKKKKKRDDDDNQINPTRLHPQSQEAETFFSVPFFGPSDQEAFRPGNQSPGASSFLLALIYLSLYEYGRSTGPRLKIRCVSNPIALRPSTAWKNAPDQRRDDPEVPEGEQRPTDTFQLDRPKMTVIPLKSVSAEHRQRRPCRSAWRIHEWPSI